MFSPLRLTLFGLFCYGLFLLIQLPARLLLESSPLPAGWRLDDPRGSVWDGEIAHVAHQGRALGKLRWELSPWHLLLGDLHADWVWDGPYGTARGEVSRGLVDQQLVFHDVQTDLGMTLVSDLGWSPFPLQGRLKGLLEQLDLTSSDYPVLSGEARWLQAGLKVGETLTFGQVTFKADPQQGHSRLTLTNARGDVGVQGEIKLLPARRVDIALRLSPRSAQGRELLKLMQSVGKASPDGGLRISYRGLLP